MDHVYTDKICPSRWLFLSSLCFAAQQTNNVAFIFFTRIATNTLEISLHWKALSFLFTSNFNTLLLLGKTKILTQDIYSYTYIYIYIYNWNKKLKHSRMACSRLGQWLTLLVCLLVLLKAESHPVALTLVENAVAKGAVCLDGSAPAYHFDKGFGAGINNWLVHVEGGGWCNTVEDCLDRKSNYRGSSTKMEKTMSFSGVLGNKPKTNPDFYNWNRIKVRYCDGSSFTGDVEAVDPATNLHFRGARVFRAIIDELLAKGMKNAQNVWPILQTVYFFHPILAADSSLALLSGCSAGGLTSILHCDNFRSLLPVGTKVKCLADAGRVCLDHNTFKAFTVKWLRYMYCLSLKPLYVQVIRGSAKNLPASCTSRMSPGLCFFPQNVVPQTRTPIFLVNAAYDSWQCFFPQNVVPLTRTPIFFVNAAYDWWQIQNILAPDVADPEGAWKKCKLNIKNCSPSQLQTMQEFRLQFLKTITGASNSSSHGWFIHSCYAHCQIEMQETWLAADSPMLCKTTIAEAVGDWYYDLTPFRKIDCPYPCNPTCKNAEFDF
ncbi:hypothetical protein DVH24_033462 [Malus domestica]|uniref:Pectin acetylesterase n=1 Tax=Malus domestica TaxID=3750 RepID=A0A498JBQ3_MALDO|nr:hypothetical protein DVH24_033462 [Malus domestica]